MKRQTVSAGIIVGLLAIAVIAGADEWPGFRGAAGTGVSSEKGLPVAWSAEKNIAWKVDLPGRGNSSPAITAKRVYVTTRHDDGTLAVRALDKATGGALWNLPVGRGQLVAPGPKSLYAHRHNAATPTPSADGKMVFAYFGSGLLVGLTDRGDSAKVAWTRDLAEEYGAYQMRFGMASSPRLWGDRLYIECLHKGGNSYVLSLDKATGKNVWKVPRPLPSADDGPDAYSTPVILERDSDTLIISGSDHVDAYDLATGKRLWQSSGLKIDSPYGRVIASPAIGDGIVVQCSANPPGTPGHVIAVRGGGKGDVTESHRLWRYTPYTSDASTPICYRGKLFMARDDGIAAILDLKTGKELWRDRLGKVTVRSSLVAGDGKVWVLSRDGVCWVLDAEQPGKILATNELPGKFYSTPAISDGRIYLRAYDRLWAIGK